MSREREIVERLGKLERKPGIPFSAVLVAVGMILGPCLLISFLLTNGTGRDR